MHRWLTGIAVLALALNLAGPAVAKKAAKKGPECSACHMALSKKKTDTMTKAVKIGKKTYYCCAGCDMSAKPAEAPK